MAKILMASVPASGHVNPGLPIARRLVERGHQVVWYCGSHFYERIIATGAQFEPFHAAPDFYDNAVENVHGTVPTHSLLAQARFCVRHVFYGPMAAYYQEMKEILKRFDADIIITDEWFTGGIPFSEKKEKKWVIYGNPPLMILSEDAPAPGTGLLPDHTKYGRYRNRVTNLIFRFLFRTLQKEINALRAEIGLPAMAHFFIEQNIAHAVLALKFTTQVFEFPRKEIPPQICFVGPVLPQTPDPEFAWMNRLKKGKPVVFITQGSVDIYDMNKLIIPSLRALQNENFMLVVSTGGKAIDGLRSRFPASNIIIEPYIPYTQIMPHISVMITNGGYGGVSTALSFGVPIIAAGSSEDKPEIATRIVYCGAGINLKTGRPSPRKIYKAVKTVLQDPRYRRNAEKVRDDFGKHDAVSESVELIEALLVSDS